MALGDDVAGVFTQSDELAQELSSASKKAREQVWRMPLPDAYEEQIKSKIADLVNVGPRAGGAITAALFLQKYVEKDTTRWAHLDIAGPVWDDKKGGATGFGAATLAKWIAGQGSA